MRYLNLRQKTECERQRFLVSCRTTGQWRVPAFLRRHQRTVLKISAAKEGMNMASLDWSQCPAVESVADRRSGAWVFRDTRMPVATVFENLEAGSSIEEIIEQFHVTREQIQAVFAFAARSLDAPSPAVDAGAVTDAHSL